MRTVCLFFFLRVWGYPETKRGFGSPKFYTSECFSGSFSVFEDILMFTDPEEFKVLRWSKAGWWWAQRGVDNQQGWVYSAQMRPKMCTSCHEKVGDSQKKCTAKDNAMFVRFLVESGASRIVCVFFWGGVEL